MVLVELQDPLVGKMVKVVQAGEMLRHVLLLVILAQELVEITAVVGVAVIIKVILVDMVVLEQYGLFIPDHQGLFLQLV